MCAAWREQVEEERPAKLGEITGGGDWLTHQPKLRSLNLFNLLKSPVLLGVGAMA